VSERDDAALIAAARKSAEGAYAPYSGFHVGAAVRTADGRIFAAPNIENVSYGLSLCAETNAVMAAVAAGARVIERVAVIGYPAKNPTSDIVATPCGRCRQVMAEFASPDTAVILIPAAGSPARTVLLRELLPFAFDTDALGCPTLRTRRAARLQARSGSASNTVRSRSSRRMRSLTRSPRTR